ncbi:MAG: helix-turn-helix transcriptional regulator [Candidatus Aureabacteria bacterium]|nr:helix-turn-helix transcriptional regulator [Candidatus Auribacterota bacterium]
MEDRQLMDKIKAVKEARGYTLYDLSRKIDVHVSTIERWMKTNRINKIYAKMVKEKLNIR